MISRISLNPFTVASCLISTSNLNYEQLISLGLWTENFPLDCLEISGESVNLEQGMMGVSYDVDILAALKVRRFLNLTI
jgi:hypothetical protein